MSPRGCPQVFENRFPLFYSVSPHISSGVLCTFSARTFHDRILQFTQPTACSSSPCESTIHSLVWCIGSTIFRFYFKNVGKKSCADYKSPEQHVGFDHLQTWGTICVHQKMKMFYRSETLICSKCSLYEWISIIGWIPHNALVPLWSSKLIIWLTNVKALS